MFDRLEQKQKPFWDYREWWNPSELKSDVVEKPPKDASLDAIKEDKKKLDLRELIELDMQDNTENSYSDRYNGQRTKTKVVDKPRRKCFICRGKNHIANDCPMEYKSLTCKASGHKS